MCDDLNIGDFCLPFILWRKDGRETFYCAKLKIDEWHRNSIKRTKQVHYLRARTQSSHRKPSGNIHFFQFKLFSLFIFRHLISESLSDVFVTVVLHMRSHMPELSWLVKSAVHFHRNRPANGARTAGALVRVYWRKIGAKC